MKTLDLEIKTRERRVNMPPQNEATIHVVADRINSLHGDVTELRDDMRNSMEKMSNAVMKLVQMEERQIYMNQSYERLNLTLDKMQTKSEKLEERVDALEKEQPLTKQAVTWIYAAVWAVVGAAALFAAKAFGIM